MWSEEEVLGFWAQKKIFEKSLKKRSKAKRFVFFEGPPYANGTPGIHHVEARAFKDVIARYKTMRGFLVERRAGWDTHGLPTEMAAEKKLGIERKRDIEEKIGIKAFVEAAREDIFFYKAEWERMTERMGYWLDFKNAYVTMAAPYIESLWWIVKEFWNKKLLYEEYKVLPWCARCGTPLSSHELAQGYREITEESIYVRFHLKTRRASLLVWTTTPWTLPANVAAAVHPDRDYVTIDDKGDKLILERSLAKKLFPELEPLWEEKGKNLAGLEYEPLYRIRGLPYKVVTGNFVSDTDGTGVVHIAPAFGEDDMAMAKREDLPIFSPVDDEGKFTEAVPQWKGMFVKDADPLIIKDLDQKGLVWKRLLYTHDYPFCWRCDTPLLYFARLSWWVRMSKIRRDLVEANKKISWYPAHLKEGRFGQWIREAKDWAFSRERYWGTPLPIWRCDACKAIEVIGSLSELAGRARSAKNIYYLVRHGFAKTNFLGISYSLTKNDTYGLTPRGIKEVKAAAKKLSKQKIDLIISSDLTRTKETTQILSRALDVPVLYDEDLRDIHLGDFEGKPITEIMQWAAIVDRFSIPFSGNGGESWNDLKKRMYRVFQRFESLHAGKRIVVVGHGDPLWFLEGMIRGKLESGKEPTLAYLKNGDVHKMVASSLPRNDYGELDLHRPYIDEIAIHCRACGKLMTRVHDVIDVWFDSGAMPYAQWHYPFEHRERIDKKISYPADFIAEAVDQTRGWFYVLLAVSALLGKGTPYKNVMSLGHVLDKSGKKMSKSRGNVVDPKALFETYGADAVRWYFFTVNQPDDTKLFDEKGVEQAKRNFLDFLFNSLRFLELYGGAKSKTENSPHLLDRWIEAKLSELTLDMSRRMEQFDIVAAARLLENFVANDISRWYLRRSRERMKAGDGLATFKYVLGEVAKLAAPFVPFSSEMLYQGLGGREESVHLEAWPERTAPSKKLLKDMEEVRALAARGLELRSRSGIKVRQPLASFSVKKTGLVDDAYLAILRDELNVKKIIVNKKIASDQALDMEITPELRREGTARELIRQLQDMRKKAGLNPRDSVLVALEGEKLEEWEPMIAKGARVRKFVPPGTITNPDIKEKIQIDGASYLLELKKI